MKAGIAVGAAACLATAGLAYAHSAAPTAHTESVQLAAASGSTPSVIPHVNSAWMYDGKSSGVWSQTIAAYNKVATGAHQLNQIYNYGSDLEDTGSSTTPETTYWGPGDSGPYDTANYYSDLDLSANISGGTQSYTSPVQLSPIIDGQIGSSVLTQFNSETTAQAQSSADGVANAVCNEDEVSGIQFDLEPFNVSTTTSGQYPFYLEIAKDFAGQNSAVPGCVDAAHPQGRYYSIFTFASNIASGSAMRANIQSILNTYNNGYMIASLYDLGSNPAGSLNDVPTYTSLVNQAVSTTVTNADQLGIHYAFGIPAGASDHEYTSCTGTCVAGANGTTGNPMLSYTKAAVSAIHGDVSATDADYVGTDIWGFSALVGTSATNVQPAAAGADVLNYLASNLPGYGTTAGSGSSSATPPSTPTGLAASNVTSSSVQLSWNASTAGSNPISGYEIFENGSSQALQTVSTTSATVSGLSASTGYTFTVAAIDNAGNASAQSSAVSVTTSAGTQSSNPVQNGNFEASSASPPASWTCTGATVTNNGDPGNAADLTPTQTTSAQCTQTVTGLTPNGSYTLSANVKAATAGTYGYVGVTGGAQAGTSNATWTLVSTPVTASSSGTLPIYIQAYKQQTGSVYFDNVTLAPAS